MGNFTDAASSAIASATCGILASNENLANWISNNTFLPFAQQQADVAAGVRRALCDDPSPISPDPPPFSGGQCPGSLYRITMGTQALSNPSSCTFGSCSVGSADVFGPVSLILEQNGDSFDCGNLFSRIALCGFDAQGEQVCIGGAASDQVLQICQSPNAQLLAGSNDCGDPPIPLRPNYVPITVPVSITYVDNTMTQVTELGDFNLFAPIVLPGAVTIPVSIETPDFNIRGNINLNGDIEFNIGNRTQDDTNTDTELPPLPPGNDPDDDEEERRIVGVYVSVVSDPNPSYSILSQDTNPDVFIPDAGLVSFLVRTGSGSGWTEDIRIKNAAQVIACPVSWGAINVKATPRAGAVVALTRIYGNVAEPDLRGA